MKNKYLIVGSTVGIIMVLDQITKYIVEQRIRMFEVIPVLPGFFNLTRVRNKGAAFSVLSTAPDVFRIAFFVTVTLAAVVVIALLIRKTHERVLVFAFSLIMGGALGNVIDRLRFGEVVDFIQWYYKSHYWPSFNVADSAITAGVVLLGIDMLFKKPQESLKKG